MPRVAAGLEDAESDLATLAQLLDEMESSAQELSYQSAKLGDDAVAKSIFNDHIGVLRSVYKIALDHELCEASPTLQRRHSVTRAVPHRGTKPSGSLARSGQQASLTRYVNRLGASLHPELRVCVLQVLLDRRDLHAEQIGGFAIRAPAGHRSEHLRLALGEN